MIPHRKNAGLFFFGALVLVALFLFISDSFVPKNSSGDQKSRVASGIAGNTSSDSGTIFAKTDWELGSSSTEQSAPIYEISDVRTTTESGRTSFETYAIGLAKALHRYSDPRALSEVRIMLNAYESNARSELTGITARQAIHRSTLTDLNNLVVPEEIAFYHLTLMNDLRSMIRADDGMLSVFENQEIGFAAGGAYLANAKQLYAALEQINTTLARHSVDSRTLTGIRMHLGNSQ